MDLSHLAELAIRAARAAGKVIRQHIDQEVAVEEKVGGSTYASQVVTAVDRACEALILDVLLPSCKSYDLGLLSEETEDDESRFQKDYFWCIDPMDGTLAFIHKRPGFSVSIALIAKDGTPCIGVVYDPSTNNLYHAIKGSGAFKNGKPWKVERTNQHLSYFTDRMLSDTPRSAEIECILQQQVEKLKLNGFQEVSGGGAVLNAIRVLENGPACLLKFPKKETGGGSIWDYAATACMYQELGLPATNFSGRRLDLNRKEGTFMHEEGVFFGNLGERLEVKSEFISVYKD